MWLIHICRCDCLLHMQVLADPDSAVVLPLLRDQLLAGMGPSAHK